MHVGQVDGGDAPGGGVYEGAPHDPDRSDAAGGVADPAKGEGTPRGDDHEVALAGAGGNVGLRVGVEKTNVMLN